MQIGDGRAKCLINFRVKFNLIKKKHGFIIWFTNIKSATVIIKYIFNICQWDLV